VQDAFVLNGRFLITKTHGYLRYMIKWSCVGQRNGVLLKDGGCYWFLIVMEKKNTLLAATTYDDRRWQSASENLVFDNVKY